MYFPTDGKLGVEFATKNDLLRRKDENRLYDVSGDVTDKYKGVEIMKWSDIYNLSGQRFGYLEVIEPIQNSRIKSNETRWKCLCHNCGRIVEVSSYWLRHSDPYGHCKCTRFEDRPE